MSLIRFLENKDVKEMFLQAFPIPKFNLKKEILAPPITKHYALVGTAFDYLMRFYLIHLNSNAITHRWVAEASVKLLVAKSRNPSEISDEKVQKLLDRIGKDGDFDYLELAIKGMDIIEQARKAQSNYIKSGKITDQLIKSAIMLAQLDPIYRAGVIDENIGVIDEGDLKDLKQLISTVNPDSFKARDRCMLNPTFGEGSKLVGGADADLLIDDTLIDIKTTKNLEFNRNSFNQLIGYYILFKIGGIDSAPSTPDIERLGIYFSRYGELYKFPIKTIIDANKLPAFIEWFKKRATDEYGK